MSKATSLEGTNTCHNPEGGASKSCVYNICVPKATIRSVAEPGPTAHHVDQFDEALQNVARSITQVRLHERLLRQAGVRLDRAGATLLFKLSAKGDSLRVTDLAEILGVDTPTVTRKVQQLERDGMVVRQIDPADRRASRDPAHTCWPQDHRTCARGSPRVARAALARVGRRSPSSLGALLSHFADDLERDLDDSRD